MRSRLTSGSFMIFLSPTARSFRAANPSLPSADQWRNCPSNRKKGCLVYSPCCPNKKIDHFKVLYIWISCVHCSAVSAKPCSHSDSVL